MFFEHRFTQTQGGASMPCTFVKGQEVKGNITDRKHIITAIMRQKRKVPAGWGHAVVEDVFVQVDNNTMPNGEPLWEGWGNFTAVE